MFMLQIIGIISQRNPENPINAAEKEKQANSHRKDENIWHGLGVQGKAEPPS